MSTAFQAKRILLGISGGIAAYKACELASRLIKAGAEVQVIMTGNATKFVAPLTLRTLTGRPVMLGMFDEVKQWKVDHIGAARWADACLLAPATANLMAKLAWGLADDLLSATCLACAKPLVIAPAMNSGMYDHPASRENRAKLAERGCLLVEPGEGMLACGDSGQGRLAEPELILLWLAYALREEKPLRGRRVLVTAGPTRESLDPVRFLTNHSSGRMGYSIAKQAWLLGGEVTLISGPVEPEALPVNRIETESGAEMADRTLAAAAGQDIIIMAAAVADYTPAVKSAVKIKKRAGGLTLELERTTDILAELGRRKKAAQTLVGFAAETEDLLANARRKLQEKNADLMAANDLTRPGAGFGGGTNQLTLLWADGRSRELALMDKDDCAYEVVAAAEEIWRERAAGL
ncbi:MAG: bifunctional phosphopantothenoylcysteine decarboxylase/phosphopantothenate--cysteine ligase CoaBC [Peptococcaceae bacterium]|nr:bifunctional phosphopantothenoylcysteine decarboxylase/phosphopantothenate--cysteine ligase CoaBC [Peptococcaceae bacterium]